MNQQSGVSYSLSRREAWTRLSVVLLYACAMGMLEAICVIYLRRLILPEGLDAGHAPLRLGRHVELIREASTIIMLGTVAWLSGRTARSRIASFFVMFGIWDILYYAGLKWLAGWPASWFTWDCLFLIPKPWYGPVLAPVLISAYFVVVCGLLYVCEESGRRVRLGPGVWALQTAGLLVWYWSFVKDTALIHAHGYKSVIYSWPLFAGGLLCCGLSVMVCVRRWVRLQPCAVECAKSVETGRLGAQDVASEADGDRLRGE